MHHEVTNGHCVIVVSADIASFLFRYNKVEIGQSLANRRLRRLPVAPWGYDMTETDTLPAASIDVLKRHDLDRERI